MAPPPSYAVPPYVSLIVRILTFACLLISLILLTTATDTATVTDYGSFKVRFKDFKAFRYLCATTVIGLAYTLLQIAFTLSLVLTGKRLGDDSFVYFDFAGDKVVSLILATGAAASLGMTQEFDDVMDDTSGLGISHFISTTNAAASLCLIGCVFTAISSVFSSLALPKRA